MKKLRQNLQKLPLNLRKLRHIPSKTRQHRKNGRRNHTILLIKQPL